MSHDELEFSEPDGQPARSRAECELVPIDPKDPIEVSVETVAEAQGVLKRFIEQGSEAGLTWFRGLAMKEVAQAAECLANVQETLAKASAAREKVHLEAMDQQHRHRIEDKRMEEDFEAQRLEAKAAALQKIARAVEMLANVGATKSQIKRLIRQAVEL